LLLITVLALTWFLLRRLHKRRLDEAAGDKYGRDSPSPSLDASFASRRPIIQSSAAAAAAAAGGPAAVGVGAANRNRSDSADPQSPTSPYGTATDDSHAAGTGVGRVVSPAPAFVPGPRSVSAQSSQQYPTATAAAAGGLGGGATAMRPHPSFATSPLSESDAASISAAFRSALAHPEFGPVDDGPLDSSEGDSPPAADDGGERMRRELEREGIGLRGVPGGRGGQTVD